ncbi:hypothetical protein ACFL3N_02505 [Candidatus Omnitrophota bacterium]
MGRRTAVVLLILISLSSVSLALDGDGFVSVSTFTTKGIIVPEGQGRNFFWGTGYKAEDYWTPTKKDVLKAEKKLVEYLKEEKPELSPELWKKAAKYNRQYVGVVIMADKKIWINFFDRSVDHPKWRKEPVLVDGGGDRYFNVLYDVSGEKFFNLQVNALL